MIYATLRADQSFAASTAGAVLRADVLVDGDVALEATQDFDGSAPVIQPRLQLDDGAGGTLAGVRILYPAVIPSWTVDGLDPGAEPAGDLKVSAELDGGFRKWSRPVVASTGSRWRGTIAAGPLGYETTRGGPPPGELVPVDFALELRDLAAAQSYVLRVLTGGYVTRSRRGWSSDGHLLELEGGGPETIYRDREIDLELAAGHGLTHGEIAVAACQAAEVPAELVAIDPGIGAPRSVPVEISCQPLWQVLRDVLRPVGFEAIFARADGLLVAVPVEVEEDAAPLMTIRAGEAGDLESADAFEVEADVAVASCVEVTGARLAEVEARRSGTGLVTSEVVIETYDDVFVLPVAVASQAAGSSTITPTGVIPGPGKRTLIHRTTVRVTTRDGCEEETYVREEGFFNPQAARYIAANTPDGELRGYPSFAVWFFDGVPVADDATEGFLWQSNRFVVLSEQWSRPVWRADGRRIGTETRSSGWKNPQASIKSRGTPATAWETTNYTASRRLTAGFQGVLFPSERYFAGAGIHEAPDDTFPTGFDPRYTNLGQVVSRHIEVAIETRTVDDDDYEIAVEIERTAYGLRDGVTRLYGSVTSRDASEVGVTSSQTEQRTTIGGRPATIQSGRDEQGRPTPTVVTRGAQGGIPAAEICTTETLGRERREEFVVTVCVERDDGLGGTVQVANRTETLRSDFVETEAEAERWGWQELSILRSFPVTLALASPAPVLDVGDVVELDMADLGLSGLAKCWSRELAVEGGRGGRVRDLVTVRVPPWE